MKEEDLRLLGRCRPSFLLLDEPLLIDPIALSDIRDLIGHLKEHGLGVLITNPQCSRNIRNC